MTKENKTLIQLIKDRDEEFDKECVKKTYPFLGGQRNYWKNKDDMSCIDGVKSHNHETIKAVLKAIIVEAEYDKNYEDTINLLKKAITHLEK